MDKCIFPSPNIFLPFLDLSHKILYYRTFLYMVADNTVFCESSVVKTLNQEKHKSVCVPAILPL